MGKRTIEDLLRAFGERGVERARPELAAEAKKRIPHRLSPHRMDTVNIIVDLRISRLTAAAAILVAMFLIGSFFGGREAIGDRLVQDGKLFLKYTIGGEKAYQADVLKGLSQFRDALIAQGRDVVYYENADLDNKYSVVMYWKLSDGKYGVILGDLTPREVSAGFLIMLQSQMLRERSQK
jgi:hypothetical protein